jgi:Protein of unknown function (DUF642)
MRALWIAGSAAVLASCLAASASANPIRLRPSWHVQSIQRNASGDCGSLPSGTGILRDGDFSQAPNPGNDTGVGPGTTFAPHWMSSGPRTIDFYGTGSGVPWSEPEGLCSVDLDGTPGPGSIRHRLFDTQPGVKYILSFLFSGNGACAPATKEMEVRIARLRKRFTWDASGGNSAQNGVWKPETLKFTAAHTRTRLEFSSRDLNAGNCGPAVAGIAVTQSP